MKRPVMLTIFALCLLAAGMMMAGCKNPAGNDPGNGSPFVPVAGITGVRTRGTVGINLALSGTVTPPDAAKQTIVWMVKDPGGTGARITGNTLSTTGPGDVVVTATITGGTAEGTPYTQDFTINISEVVVPVNWITHVPVTGTAGQPLTLRGTVNPFEASDQTIIWTVKDPGRTGAGITGNTLSTTGPGPVVVTATIADGIAVGTPYTQDFEITLVFVPVAGITDVLPGTGSVTLALLAGTVTPSEASYQTIVWTVKNPGETGAGIKGDTLLTTRPGEVVVTATIANGTAVGTPYTQDFTIAILPQYTLKQVPGGTVTINNTGGDGDGEENYDRDIWAAGVVYGRNWWGTGGFSMGETEITYELWKFVYDWATDDRARGDKKYSFAHPGWQGGAEGGADPEGNINQHPVTGISWRDAVVWCNAYSEILGKEPVYKNGNVVCRSSKASSFNDPEDNDNDANGFRLPNEAEWEYAARGGEPGNPESQDPIPPDTPWTYKYAGSNDINEVAVYNSGHSTSTAPVKSKSPNTLGLYDMSGNVFEFCQNKDRESESSRAVRGGAWSTDEEECKVNRRYSINPSELCNNELTVPIGTCGFRVACRP